MAQVGSLSRLVGVVAKVPNKGSFLAATSFHFHEPSHLGSINEANPSNRNLQQVNTVQDHNINEAEICNNLRHLTLSPLEARMSAEALTSCTVSKLSPLSSQEIRLPSLIRPLSIVVPTLNTSIMEMPAVPSHSDKIEPQIPQLDIEAPSGQAEVEKQAARLIVIRRRKMRKHKLKKLRKKMKYEILKVRQKREYMKEKRFQAEEMARVREYEAFSAEDYVADILYKVNARPTPNLWKGKKLPKPIIEELMVEEKEKREKKKADKAYREAWFKKMEEKGTLYDKEVEYMPLSEFLQSVKKS